MSFIHRSRLRFSVFNDTDWDNLYAKETIAIEKQSMWQQQTESMTNQPDTALLQFILLVITFLVAYFLKKLRFSIYCGRTIRRAVGDFGVPIAVVVGTFVDQVIFSDVYTRVCFFGDVLWLCLAEKIFFQHVNMKKTFDLTRPDLRGWFVNPMGGGKDGMLPAWVIPATIVPAILVTILLYAEVEIIESVKFFLSELLFLSI